MKAVIVEDEAVAARRMQRLLASKGIEVLTTVSSNAELATYLAGHERPSVFFMDIHLSDGVVFDLLAEAKIEVPIIFTTAYDQYAIRAFKQNSIDYLMKPIDEDELEAAIAKLKKLTAPVDLMALKTLLATKQSVPAYRDRISVKVGDKIRSIAITDVQLFFSADKINNHDGRAYPIDYTIEQIYGQLQPRQFFRVSRSYIVSITAITDVVSYSNSRLKVLIANSAAHDIIVARERVREFKSWLG